MEIEQIFQGQSQCDLSTNQSISKWYSFILFALSALIILIIIVNVGINCVKLYRNRLYISDVTASSFEYQPLQ